MTGPTYLGLDLGTSALKALIVDETQAVLAGTDVPLAIQRPRDLWSEQDPRDWWHAVEQAVAVLRLAAPDAWRRIAGIGLSGQMHGAVLLGADDEPLRPAILWNDGRAGAECDTLMAAVPDLAVIAGIEAMPGFLAPKLLWLRAHEPQTFQRIARIMLPKDFLALHLTGAFVTDMSDAAGSLLLDEAARDWSAPILDACEIATSQLPHLKEGPDPAGVLRPDLAAGWGLSPSVVVATGGGDAACGAIGIGAIADGQAFISLGTSAQIFVARQTHAPKPGTGIHAFCHALPGRWFQMAALLNGASCVGWAARLAGRSDIDVLVEEVEAGFRVPSDLLFLPYLQGERTPHNDPNAKGVLFGLHGGSDAAAVLQSVLEGVAFSLADAQEALASAGARPERLSVIGGGSRNLFWMRIIASVLNKPLVLHPGADKGPAFGATRLARLAVTNELADAVCTVPPAGLVIEPEKRLVEAYAARLPRFRALYRALRQEFRAA